VRAVLPFLLLGLAACSPAPRPEAPAPETPPSAAHANAAALAGPALEGQWFFHGDEGVITAGFGEPESEYRLTISCELPTGRVTITSEHELAPEQDTTLYVLTATNTIVLPARSRHVSMPQVYGALDGEDPRLDALAERQERFATQAAGTTLVFPWDEAVPRVLDACGVR
jgi:hypothetical protein